MTPLYTRPEGICLLKSTETGIRSRWGNTSHVDPFIKTGYYKMEEISEGRRTGLLIKKRKRLRYHVC